MLNFDPVVFNAVYPIVGVTVYSNGVMVVKRECLLQAQNENRNNGRKEREIVRFTEKSMSRLVATINATDVKLNSMITLTYPELYPLDGRKVKEDLNRFLNILRRAYPSEFLWFLEFQTRGAPHFHMLTEHKAITPKMRIAVAENWVSGIARAEWFRVAVAESALKQNCKCEYEEMRKHLGRSYAFTLRRETWELLRSLDGAKRYVTKYAVKEYQKKPPKDFVGVGRFWGCSEGVKLGEGKFIDVKEKDFREFLKNQDHATSEWDVVPKYLFNVQNI